MKNACCDKVEQRYSPIMTWNTTVQCSVQQYGVLIARKHYRWRRLHDTPVQSPYHLLQPTCNWHRSFSCQTERIINYGQRHSWLYLNYHDTTIWLRKIWHKKLRRNNSQKLKICRLEIYWTLMWLSEIRKMALWNMAEVQESDHTRLGAWHLWNIYKR